MCLAIPGQVKSIGLQNMADVDIMGVSRQVSLDLTPEARIDDYVLVHAGYAIQVVDERFAAETLELLEGLEDDELPGPAAPGLSPAADLKTGA